MVLTRTSSVRNRIRAIALLATASLSMLAQAPAPATPAPATGTTQTSPATTQASSAAPASTTTQTTPKAAPKAPTLTLPQQIAALPKIDAPGIDPDARGKEILAHLNAVLRFYRDSLSETQKVGEPSDVLYSGQASAQATQIAQFAFQAARNESALLGKIANAPAPQQKPDDDEEGDAASSGPTQAQRLAQFRAATQAKLNDLITQDTALDKQIASAKAKDLPALRQQDEQIEGQVELQKAMLEALGKVASLAETTPGTGLAADIDRLSRTAPELAATNTKPIAPPILQNLESARDSGVSSQAVVLFQLLATRRAIDGRIAAATALAQQAESMRKPMVGLLQATLKQGDAAMQSAPDTKASDADTLAATRKHYDALANTFRVLSTATLPLTEELVLLEQSRANLRAWRSVVDAEYTSVLHGLLLRVLGIAIALAVLLLISQVWQRLTVKYIHDLRRRRQLVAIRRLVIGFLGGIVVIFGFVTQFNSLATFAGFITAGIAVGLQTILLSVAAYFFIIGRYGVRVGDRITVAGVTGDVVDVGLVRFYMMELTGTGTELHPTGRVAVFANSVLFQAGTPLYKQVPGTEYAWHELTVRLNPAADYRAATETILDTVKRVYETYRHAIELQHRQVEDWMDAAVDAPGIQPRLQLAETGLQYAVLFPVEIKDAAITDERIVHDVLEAISTNETVKTAVAAPPTVKAVIKG